MKKATITIYLLTICIFGKAQLLLNLKIDSILAEYNQLNSPGLSVAVIKNGEFIYKKSVGLSNLEYGIQNSDSSIYSLASIAKQFTSACIWALIKEGKINLDDNVRTYIPELPDNYAIKIRHLLNHTSGLRNYHTIMELSGFDYDLEYYDNNTVLQLICRQNALNNIPGEKVIYGNTSYTLLAIIIERITKENLNDFAKSKIFEPLGMQHTFFKTENHSIIKNRAVGYVKNTVSGFSQYPSVQCSYGAGSMGSTIKDLATWCNVLNGNNPAFKDLSKFLTTQDTLPNKEIANYARGVIIDNYKGLKTVHHSGFGLGCQTQLITIPETGLSIIVLTNSGNINPTPISYKILDLIIPEHMTKSSPADKIKNNRNLVRFTGQYQEINSDMKMEIILDHDTLKSKGSQGSKYISLLPYESNKFFRKNSQNIKYEFNTTKSAQYDLVVYFGGAPFYFKRAIFIDLKDITLEEYTGKFYSKELNTSYTIFTENNNLYLSYKNHEHILLSPGQSDEFGSGNRILYTFERNRENKIEKLYVAAEGSIKDVEFNIINSSR
jgi:CubicO group peptidase (beta-lactamase class C family)